ncbi:MAG TPA: S41 family peptidase [Bacteroidales bacterium]|nr:S41 family peptidase [Bacteroidales bacterium]
MKKNLSIYLPLLFSLVLAGGIYIGINIPAVQREGEMPSLQFGGSKSGKLDMILNFIERDYVDTVDRRNLENTAITGMLEKLDPHSSFITPEMFHEMNDPLLGSFEGIGVSFRIEKDTIMVINPVKGGPSERVGIMAGDRIVMIDDTLVAGTGITNRDAMRRLKGPKGTQVRVSVSRRGVKGLKDYTITRDVIPTYSLDIAYMIDDQTGFIRLNKFSATTYREFLEAARKLRREGMQRLILDLRGNAGGYLKAATDIADEFLPNGKLIVYTQGKNRPRSYTFATRNGMLEEMPVVVLIDEGSASASEIVAGAIQDNDRGTIIGRRSFGKGLVQEQMSLRDGSAIRLTVARYYTPTGRSIQRPYDGDFEKYHLEPMERFLNGELSNPDSIHFADTVKFVTPGGKVVYGGGGILPDVYVPLKTDSTLFFFNRLANSGLIFQYAFDYADANRSNLRQYKNVSDFITRFQVSNSMLENLYRQASERGITAGNAAKSGSARHVSILLKAYIGRNLFDDEGFYPIYQQIDEVLQQAIRHFNQPNT